MLVKNVYTGINFIDTYFRKVWEQRPPLPPTPVHPRPPLSLTRPYPCLAIPVCPPARLPSACLQGPALGPAYTQALPFISGQEGGGEIVQLTPKAEAAGLRVGDRVAYSVLGTYCEYTAVPAAKILPVPDEIGLDVATACMTQGLTAHYLTQGETSAHHGIAQPGEPTRAGRTRAHSSTFLIWKVGTRTRAYSSTCHIRKVVGTRTRAHSSTFLGIPNMASARAREPIRPPIASSPHP